MNYKLLQDNDINPVFIFNNDGKIMYANKSAQLMSDMHIDKKLFALAMDYAPKSYGKSTNYIDVNYNNNSFYGFMIVYEDEDYLYLQLYKKPPNVIKNTKLLGYKKIDFNMLLSANIEINNKNTNLSLTTDYDIPPCYLHQNTFCILMREIFASLNNSNYINISVKIKMGEMIIVAEQKCYIICLDIGFDTRDNCNNNIINSLSKQSHILLSMDDNKIDLEIPCITKI